MNDVRSYPITPSLITTPSIVTLPRPGTIRYTLALEV